MPQFAKSFKSERSDPRIVLGPDPFNKLFAAFGLFILYRRDMGSLTGVYGSIGTC